MKELQPVGERCGRTLFIQGSMKETLARERLVGLFSDSYLRSFLRSVSTLISSFFRSFVLLFVLSFVRSFVRSFVHKLVGLLICWFAGSLVR